MNHYLFTKDVDVNVARLYCTVALMYSGGLTVCSAPTEGGAQTRGITFSVFTNYNQQQQQL